MNLTLDERAKFESLLAEYANAEMDCVRASGRRHNALHAVQHYVNDRTKQKMLDAYERGVLAVRGEPPLPNPKALLDADVVRGAKHEKSDAPVEGCGCATCCEIRADQRERAKADLRQIAETGNNLTPTPISDTSGGN